MKGELNAYIHTYKEKMLRECGVEVIWTNTCKRCDGDWYYWSEPTHPTHDYSRRIKCDCKNKWLAQYLKGESMWYLTEHGEDGIESELFPKTRKELDEYIEKYNLTVEFADGDENRTK